MNRTALQTMHDQLEALAQAQDYRAAQALLKDRFMLLPEDLQGRILTMLLADALVSEARMLDGALALENESITALKALEEMRIVLGPDH